MIHVLTFIQQDIDDALPDLPVSYPSTDANFGRATQDACYALLSRVDLYAASPLFNPTNDLAKWQKAADAAAVFTENGDRGYSLYPDYQYCLTRTVVLQRMSIFLRGNFTTSNPQEAPPNNLGRRYGAYGGWWASNGPTKI